jgi:hypothetical protein
MAATRACATRSSGGQRGSIFERHYNAVSATELHEGIMRLYADAPL